MPHQRQNAERKAFRIFTATIAILVGAIFTAAMPRAAQAASPLGVNLAWNYDWTPQQMFTDLVKQARGWDTIGHAGADDAARDSAGWPTSDFQVVFIEEPSGAPDWTNGGAYSITFTGQATIADAWGVGATVSNQVYNSSTNTTTATFNVPAGALHVWISFTGTKRTSASGTNTGITNLTVIRPGYPANGSTVFTSSFTAAISKFSCFRTMNPEEMNNCDTNINYPTTTDWSNRRLPSWPLQGGQEKPAGTDNRFFGVSWEYMIEAANACNTDIWVNIPTSATDNYVNQLATLLKNGDTVNGVSYPALHSGAHIYVELGNELWNGFSQGGYIQSWATALGLTRWQEIGSRTAQISNDFKGVWGSAAINTTIRVLLPGQHGNSGTYTPGADYINAHYGTVNTVIYGFCTAPYYFANATTNSISAVESSLSAASSADLSSRNGSSYADIPEAQSYGVQSLAYEGGPDMSTDSSVPQATRDAASRDSGMTSIMVTDLTTNWFNIGGGLYMHYELTDSYGGGDWGLMETPSNLSTAKWSAINQVLGTGGAPPAPAGLTASAGNAQASLSWSASSGATSYNVYRGTASGGESTTAIATGVLTTTYTNAGLTNGTTYYYKVKAINASGASGYSNEASATPQSSGGTNMVQNPGFETGALNPSWNWCGGTTGISTTSPHGGTYCGYEAGGYADVGQVVTGLTANTKYTLTVWAKLSGTTSSAIYLFAKTYGGNEVDTSVTTTSWAQYSLTFTTGATNTSATIGVEDNNGSAITCYCDDFSLTSGSGSPPPAPTGLSASAGNAQVSLSWTASTGATSYNVYRGTTAGGESTTAIATGITATNYTNTGLTNGTKYYFTVKAVNSSGASGASNEASATPVAATNLVQNPGFETGAINPLWNWCGGTTGVSTTTPHAGTYCGYEAGGYADVGQVVTGLASSHTYTLKCWAKLSGTLPTGDHVYLFAKTYGGNEVDTAVTSTSWTQYTLSFTTGSTNTSATIGVEDSNGSSITGYCDDFTLN